MVTGHAAIIPEPGGGFKPGPWRYLSDEAQVRLAVRAVLRAPVPMRFSINLEPMVAAQAATSPDWFRRRLVRNLQRTLGRDVALLVCFDIDDDKRLHVHGAIACEDISEQESVRTACLDAGGTDRRIPNQTHLDVLDPTKDWAGYCVRHLPQVRRAFPDIGLGYSMTNALRTVAKSLHENSAEKPCRENSQQC